MGNFAKWLENKGWEGTVVKTFELDKKNNVIPKKQASGGSIGNNNKNKNDDNSGKKCECECIPCSKFAKCSDCSCKNCKCKGCKCNMLNKIEKYNK